MPSPSRYHRCICCSILLCDRYTAQGPGQVLSGAQSTSLFGGDTKISQVPGWTPVCTRLALRPRRNNHHRPLRDHCCCLPLYRPRRLRIYCLSRLNNSAHALPVYASQCASPRPTQHSVLAGGQPLPDRIGYLSGPHPKVSRLPLLAAFLFPFAKLAWRNCTCRVTVIQRQSHFLVCTRRSEYNRKAIYIIPNFLTLPRSIKL